MHHDRVLARAVHAMNRAARGGRQLPDDYQFRGDEPYTIGYIHSPVPGRTDKLPSTVPAGAYVIPADIVSGFGEGNSVAGGHFLEKLFHSGPYGAPRRAYGGRTGDHERRPVILAGGEFVVAPDAVRKFGGGSLDEGHEVLDRFVKRQRKELITTLKRLPGPKKS